MARAALTTLLAAALACAATRPLATSSGACPEYRDLTCLTAPECAMDPARGCEVCRCSPASRPLDLAPAPDQREAVQVVPPERPDVKR